MRLSFSVLARDRKFSKAIDRIHGKLQPLLDAFERVEMMDPIHEAILVGITDTKPAMFFEEIENDDGFFQVIAGVEYSGADDELTRAIFEILRKATSACPFSRPDLETFDSLFDRMRPIVLG
jgi:hypothetical protein